MPPKTRMQELGDLIAAGFTFRGGDGLEPPTDEMFPPLPDDLAALSEDELGSLYDEMMAVVAAVDSGDEEVIGDRTPAQVIAAMTAGVEAIEAIREERSSRDLQSSENAAALAELTRRALGNDDDPEAATPAEEPDGEQEPAAAAEEPEAIAASGAPRRPPVGRAAGRAPRPAAAPRPRIVVNEPTPTLSLTAAGDVPGRSAGSSIEWGRDLSDAFLRKYRTYANQPGSGNETTVPVATIHGEWAEDRMLRIGDTDGNSEKINRVLSEALTADGGLCAPVTPYYGLETLAETMRPVRDMLPRFGAERGGIQFATPPRLSDITTSVGIVTNVQNKLGGSWATKTSQKIPCPAWHEVDVDSIYHQLTVDNLGSRAWPELISQFTETMMAGFARTAETHLIDLIAAQVTAKVTGAAVAGSASTLLGHILEAGAGMRSRNRMARDRTLRALFPQWILDQLVEDLVRQQFGRFEHSQQGVIDLMRSYNIDPVFTPDGPTGGGQVFGAQSTGVMAKFPTSLIWYLWPEGSFLWLDSGSIDIGLVRDSVLNAQNNFQQFGESFESVAFVGIEALQITSAICPNGAVTAPVTVSCPLP